MELIQPDQDVSLIVQRTLKITCDVEEKDWVRNNAFHTRCTSQDKVCMMIIDSVSFENVVSMEMIEKLNLKIVSHPCPYKLHVFQSGNEIKINKKCLVSFSFGKFENTIWRNIATMDAYHILLGRP